MAKLTINRGTNSNDGTGDSLRDGADKINSNFSEVYSILGDGNNLLTRDIDFGENKIFFSNTVQTVQNLSSLDASKYLGMIIHVQSTGSLYYAHSGAWRKLLTDNSALNVPQYVEPLSNVAYSGNYNSLSNRPTIPTKITDIGIEDGSAGQVLTTDGIGNFVFRDVEATSISFNNVTNKPTTLAGYGINDAFTGRYEDLLNKPTLFSGSYNDLTDKPNIPQDINELNDDDGLLFDGSYSSLSGRPVIPEDINQLTDSSNLLFDGNYNNLTNKPTSFTLSSLSMALGVSVDEFSNDTTFGSNSQTALVTEYAVKTYVDNQISTIPNGGANVTIQDAAPESPSAGDLWWESDTGRLKIYYNDGTSSQWVDTSPPLAVSIPGPYADDAEAATAGVAIGSPYHKTGTSGQVFVRLS